MSARHLSGVSLRRGLMAGGQRVIAQREEINRINVYPIADHDTGTNLAATLGVVMQGLQASRPGGAGAVLRLAAAEAGDGARGNSGAILACFLQGAAESVGDRPRLPLPELAEAAARGLGRARSAMSAPADGTILTVMQAFTEEFRAQAEVGVADVRTGFARALERSRTALQDTRHQLPALRAAGVVDAGAQGFVSLLEGIGDFVARGRAAPPAEVPGELVAPGVEVGRGDGDVAYRYSVDCLVGAPQVDRVQLKAALHDLPHSHLVLSGTRDLLRLHAHVDDPGALFAAAGRFGTVSMPWIEDLQAPGTRRRCTVAVVTDTGGDIPREEIAAQGIHLIPQRVSVGDRDHVDLVTLSPREFYAAMRTLPVPPRTSQPPPGDFRRMFSFLRSHHDDVVAVVVSGALSGTLQAARTAATAGVQVFDSRSASVGQGLLAIWAAEAARARLPAGRIIAGLERMRARTVVHAAVRDIRYGVRGGRAPRVALWLTRLFRFSILLRTKPDGRLGLAGGLWGGEGLPERFARRVLRRLDRSRRYRFLVGHCDCEDDARRVLAALEAGSLQVDRSWVVETGTAIGAHAGPGSLVIGVQEYEAPGP